MKQKIIFQYKSTNEVFDFLKTNKKRATFNFLNLHDLYHANKEPSFKISILEKQNINFIDGFVISAYLSIFNLRKVSRTSGPVLTKNILFNKELSQNKKHFFLGPEKKDIEALQKKIPHLKKISSYNPPYIKNLNFPKEEIEKIAKLINKEKPDYVWVGIGCPKQNLLSSALIPETTAQYFFNVGAALDFVLGKKKQAPLIIRKLGIEWLYRLVTDFKYSKKKVWRSLMGMKYLKDIQKRKNKY